MAGDCENLLVTRDSVLGGFPGKCYQSSSMTTASSDYLHSPVIKLLSIFCKIHLAVAVKNEKGKQLIESELS